MIRTRPGLPRLLHRLGLIAACALGGCTAELWNPPMAPARMVVPTAEVRALDGVYAADAGGLAAIVTLVHPRWDEVDTTDAYWFDAPEPATAPDAPLAGARRIPLPLSGPSRGRPFAKAAEGEPPSSLLGAVEEHAGPGRWLALGTPLRVGASPPRGTLPATEPIGFVVLPGPYPGAAADAVAPEPLEAREIARRILLTPVTLTADAVTILTLTFLSGMNGDSALGF